MLQEKKGRRIRRRCTTGSASSEQMEILRATDEPRKVLRLVLSEDDGSSQSGDVAVASDDVWLGAYILEGNNG